MPKPIVKSIPTDDRLQSTWDLLTGPPSDEEIDAEVARLETLDAGERARELEAAGFSRNEVVASARQLRERLDDSAALESVGAEHEPRREKEQETRAVFQPVQAVPDIALEAPRDARTRVIRFVTVALVAAACGIVVVEVTAHRAKEPFIAQPSPSISAAPAPPERAPAATPAGELRQRATLACRASSWAECRDLLDRAAGMDPRGDRDPEVVRLRRQIADSVTAPLGPKPQ